MDFTPPPDWPPPPAGYYLLENPWPLALCLGVVAVGMAVLAHRSGRKPQGAFAGVAGVLAAGLIVAALLIETDREAMAARTRELVNAAVQPVDVEVFRRTLSKDVKLFDRDHDDLIGSVERGLARWRVKQAFITALKPDQADATRGRTYMAVLTRVDTSLGGGSTLTRWILHWKKEPDNQWRVNKIEWLSLGDEPARAGDLP